MDRTEEIEEYKATIFKVPLKIGETGTKPNATTEWWLACVRERHIIIDIEYFWLTYLKPLSSLVLSVIFGCLSFIILYAELAHTFGIENNLIYNIVTVPESYNDSGSFLLSDVTFPTLFPQPIVLLPCPLDVPSLRNQLRALLAKDLQYLRAPQWTPHGPPLPSLLKHAHDAHGRAH
jgi:hypothetical protein